jgi:hypothetical protein
MLRTGAGKWRNGRRSRLKSGRGNSCGFDSHLPYHEVLPNSARPPLKDTREGRATPMEQPASASPPNPIDNVIFRRAVDAVIWGMPIVSFDALRQAYFRDAKAAYNDIIWWPKCSGWKNQTLTANTSLRYIFAFANTHRDGPVVVDIPPAVDRASFYGTIEDAWQEPLIDVGVDGKGGKYLILPPGHAGDIPSGYTPVPAKTFNTFIGIRSIVATMSEDDVGTGDALVSRIRVYPLKEASNPQAQRFVDMTDILYNGLVKYDASIYASLARMLNEEPVQSRDLQMMGMLLPLGIENGVEFKPDAATAEILASASAAAQAWLVSKLPTFVTPWWPRSNWCIPVAPIAVKSAFTWEAPNYFDVDSRGIAFSTFFAPPAKLGGGSFYLGTYRDDGGALLNGTVAYRLHVPANVPVGEFWAVTVYSVETSSFFKNSTRLTVGSLDKGLKKNGDGSVDVYFGSTPPTGQESNWLYTPEGEPWTPWFRFYGPEKALFDKSWTMPDIERIK